MKMGRERAVMRWDIRASLLRGRIAHAEQALAAALGPSSRPRERDKQLRLERELADLHAQLDALGPSPRAKMG